MDFQEVDSRPVSTYLNQPVNFFSVVCSGVSPTRGAGVHHRGQRCHGSNNMHLLYYHVWPLLHTLVRPQLQNNNYSWSPFTKGIIRFIGCVVWAAKYVCWLLVGWKTCSWCQGRQSWGVWGVATPRFWAGGRWGFLGGRERVWENTIAYFAQKLC